MFVIAHARTRYAATRSDAHRLDTARRASRGPGRRMLDAAAETLRRSLGKEK